MKKKVILIIAIVAIMIPAVFWAVSLFRCEILTKKYYDDFQQAYTQNTMLGEMEYFKVLSCDGNTSEVYYVSKGMTDANVLTFRNNNGVWQETSWETIWSASGSASEVVYPYWWHFIYGGL
ncbi:MAG: hypothetical protein J6D06_00550 [Clostridia bacterium]|nr:hypothetical protein [Clostridia bacterium]